MTDSKNLQQVRAEIDALDRQIQELLGQRAACARQVAVIKTAEALAEDHPDDPLFYRPEREAQVLRRIREQADGPLPQASLAAIFREIMSACLALEYPLQVAYLGPEGTFTQAAAIKHFGHAVLNRPAPSIDAVFALVESGECHYGVVPVENSTEGMVSHTLDNFMESSLHICGEVEVRIQHHLLVAAGVELAGIERIHAHQQALAQCRNWLDQHCPKVERVAVFSNGEAARLAAAEPGCAAVAGDLAAEKYKLQALASNIEDQADNTTRFLVVGRETVAPSGRDKTSLIVSSRNKPGALYKLLAPFGAAGISLTRIDTRPSRTEKWAYVFFIEFEGHLQDQKIADIVSELEEQSILLKPLGSYPAAVL